jgi:dipeptidase E
MKLFLSGGGSGIKTEELDKLFADALDKTKPLLYIPIAMDTERHSYPDCLKWLTNAFDKFGVKKYTMWDEKKIYENKKENVKNFSGIFIGGGNTPYLLKILKDSGLYGFIEEAISKNIPIYGGSAGAIIFAKTIIPSLSADDNFVGLKDFSSFNRVNDYEIWCHYDFSLDNQIREYMKQYKLKKVVALAEDCGIIIRDEKMVIIGKSSAFVFDKDKKEEIKNGCELK